MDAAFGLSVPQAPSAWILGSGKIGHEIHCKAIASALGLITDYRLIAPRLLFRGLAPFGPIDPKDSPKHPGSVLAPPFPDIAIAAGRTTVPYLRHIKKASNGRTFTIFLQDPRAGLGVADFIWVPEHDPLRGPNVMTTLTSPHSIGPADLSAARRFPDPRLVRLPQPRTAVILGGNSAHHQFTKGDIARLREIVHGILANIGSVMITPSRRTPPALMEALRAEAESFPSRCFIWDGEGDNPYLGILAMAHSIIVTGDSVNMVGEAAATGVPVHVFEPSGGHPKVTGFVDELVKRGAVRRWSGALEQWHYEPIDATEEIAAEISKRYAQFKQTLS